MVNPTTEAFVTPHSLTFTSDGTRFMTGSENQISVFDVSASGQPPVSTYRTGPRSSRSTWSNPGTSTRGIVSALVKDENFDILATGTLTRYVGLYDFAAQAQCVGVFSVAGTEADKDVGGSGITQVLWSSCGRYLYIVERKSDGFMVYDIRKTGQLLSWAKGRKANTNQRMATDLVSNEQNLGQEMWGGGLDGTVRMWKSLQESEGAVPPAFETQAHKGM